MLADYRIEANIAINRTMLHRDYETAVFTGSLLDSVVYTAARYGQILGDNSVMGSTLVSWELLCQLTMQMFRDSFSVDRIILLEREPETNWENELVEGWVYAMEMHDLSYIRFNSSDLQNEEYSAKLIDEVINGGVQVSREDGESERSAVEVEPGTD